jgi:hypothetical protein
MTAIEIVAVIVLCLVAIALLRAVGFGVVVLMTRLFDRN